MSGQPSPSEPASAAELQTLAAFQRFNLVERIQAADWFRRFKGQVGQNSNVMAMHSERRCVMSSVASQRLTACRLLTEA